MGSRGWRYGLYVVMFMDINGDYNMILSMKLRGYTSDIPPGNQTTKWRVLMGKII